MVTKVFWAVARVVVYSHMNWDYYTTVTSESKYSTCQDDFVTAVVAKSQRVNSSHIYNTYDISNRIIKPDFNIQSKVHLASFSALGERKRESESYCSLISSRSDSTWQL